MINLEAFIKNKSLFINGMKYLISNYPDNLDIDNLIDLRIARFLYKKRNSYKILK